MSEAATNAVDNSAQTMPVEREPPAPIADPAQAASLLRWLVEAGVEVAVQDEPVDRFRASAEARLAAVKPAEGFPAKRIAMPAAAPGPAMRPDAVARAPAVATGQAAAIPGEEAIQTARQMASAARTLAELREALSSFNGCNLRLTAKNLVFADGNPQARVMFVGEAPGRDEDIEGLPFVGRSGKLLDRMLAAIGLDRTGAYIANIIPWRPPGNRTPTPQESAICLPFIQRQIELVDPDILICMGGPSSQTLLGLKEGITKTRGRWYGYNTGTREIRAMPTFHPAFLLRSPLQKRLAWRDFLAIKKALDETPAS